MVDKIELMLVNILKDCKACSVCNNHSWVGSAETWKVKTAADLRTRAINTIIESVNAIDESPYTALYEGMAEACLSCDGSMPRMKQVYETTE